MPGPGVKGLVATLRARKEGAGGEAYCATPEYCVQQVDGKCLCESAELAAVSDCD